MRRNSRALLGSSFAGVLERAQQILDVIPLYPRIKRLAGELAGDRSPHEDPDIDVVLKRSFDLFGDVVAAFVVGARPTREDKRPQSEATKSRGRQGVVVHARLGPRDAARGSVFFGLNSGGRHRA